MATLTLNYRFTLPAFDVPGWDVAMNANLTSIDSILAQFNIGINLQGLWINSQAYTAGQSVIDGLTAHIWTCAVNHTSAPSPTTFLTDRTNNPTYWTDITNPAIPANQSAINAAASQAAASASQTAAAASATAAAASATTVAGQIASVTAQAMENVGRNVAHNSEFLVQQRSAGPWTTNTYTADRWIQTPIGDTLSTTIAALADADRTAIGDEAAVSTLRSVVTGSAVATSFSMMEHRMESVQRYGGKSVTVSFWAKAAAGTPSIGIGAQQLFGSGGSPSAAVVINATPVVLSTTWTRYNVTLAIPTTIGKTLGTTAGTDMTNIRFWFSSGANNNTLAGGIGVQSATFSLWGVQVEVGTTMTSFEKKDIGKHTIDCQRFFFAGGGELIGYATSGLTVGVHVGYPVTMRAVPTVTSVSSAGCVNMTIATASSLNIQNAIISGTLVATGGFQLQQTFTASADL